MNTTHLVRALIALAAVLAASPASAALFGWSGSGAGAGTGAGTAWLTVGNWTNNSGLPGSADLVFFGAGGSGTSIGINFSTVATGNTNLGAIVLGGGSTVDRTIGNSSTTLGIATRLYLHGLGGGLITNAVSGRTLTLTSFAGGSGPGMTNVLMASGIIEAVGNIFINNSIIESGGARTITKTGPGILSLGAQNAFTGKMIVNAGTVVISDENRLGNNPAAFTADALTLNGGTLLAANNVTIDDANRGVTLGASHGTFAASNTIQLNIARPITGPGNLTNNGTGTLILSVANTYSGRTILRAGVTRVLNGTSLGTLPGAYAADQIIFENNATFLNQDSEFTLEPNRGITLASTGGRLQSGFGRTWAVGSIITGPGALTISGDPTPGYVRLLAANTFAGEMIVNNNTGGATWALVAVHGSIAPGGVVRVTTNGWLLGSGTLDRTVIATNGGTVGGGEIGVPGTLTVNGNLLLTNAILHSDLAVPGTVGSGVNDLLQVNGDVVLSGVVTVRPSGLAGNIAPGTYRLVNYTGTLTGGAANLAAVADGYTVTFDTSTPGQINLILSGTPNTVVWKGTAGPLNAPLWDVANTVNWAAGLTPVPFLQNQSVLFDDTGLYGVGSIPTPVTLAGQSAGFGALMPASITVDTTNNVTLNGNAGAKIGGATGLTKRGPGILSLTTANGNFPNDYTGPTVVEGGLLRPGYARAFGATNGPTIATNAGTLDVNGQSLGTEPFIASGAGVGGNGAIINLGGAQNNALRYLTLAGDTVVGGTGRWDVRDYAANNLSGARMDGEGYALTKRGPNQISFVGTGDTDLGDIVVEAGLLQFEGNATMGRTGPADEVTVMPGGSLGLWGSTVFSLKWIQLTNNGRLFKDNGNTTNLAPVTLLGGTAMIDVANNSGNIYTLSNRLEGVGGFAKIGAGLLQLATNNSHAGPTIVSNGTLQLLENATLDNSSLIDVKSGAILDVTRKAGAGGLTLASGQTLQGAGSVAGSINAGAGTTLVPGNGPGILTIQSNLTLSGAYLVYDYGNATNEGFTTTDLIRVGRDLTLSGVNNVEIRPGGILNTAAGAYYTLFRYTNALSGGAPNLNVTSDSRYSFTVDTSVPNLVRFAASGSYGNLVWQGGAPGAEKRWDIKSTANWTNYAGTGTPEIFYQGDSVNFDDTSPVREVELVGQLTVAGLGVAGSGDFTFTGSGGFSRLEGGVIKAGSGRWIIANSNPLHAMGMLIVGGTVQIGNGGTVGDIGLPSSVGNSGSLVFNRSDNLVFSHNISGTGSLTKDGAGTVTLGGANTFLGSITVNNGTLRQGSAGAFGSTVGLTVNNGGQIDLAGVAPTVRSNRYQLAGAGPDGRGALINSGGNISGNAGVSNVVLTGDAAIGIWGSGPDLGRVDIGTGATGAGLFGVFDANNFNFAKVGPGTLNIRVPTTNFPVAVVSNGILKAESFNFILPTNVIVQAGAIVGTFGAAITNASAITLQPGGGIYNDGGSGAATWLGPLTNSGNTTISVLGTNGNGGHIFLSNVFGSGLISVLGGNSRNVDLYENNDATYSGGWVVAGSTGLRAVGNGTLGTVTITNFGTVDFLKTNAYAFAGGIRGNGLIRHLTGGGALTLGGMVEAANIQAQGGGSNDAAGLTFAPGAQVFVQSTLSAGHANTGGRLIFDSATVNAANLFLGEQASQTGLVAHVNSTVTVTNQVRLGHWPTEVSTYNMDGGSFTVTVDPAANPSGAAEQNGGFYIGVDGVAIFNHNSGTLNLPALVLDNRGSTALAPVTNTYNLNGGTLTLGRWGIQSPNTTYQINLGGGVIESSANWTSVLRMTLTNGNVTFNPASGRTNLLGGVLSGTAGLVKNGAGTLFLTNAGNNIPGTVQVLNGTLHGNGILGGALTVAASGTFSPGASAGVATATNVTLSGNTFMEVSRSGVTLTNDRLVVAGTLDFGGTLTIANIGQTLIGGEVFDLFDFDTGLSSGMFTSFNLPALAPNLSWDTSTLYVDGIVRVVGSPSITTAPASQTVYENDNVFFRATVEHFQPFTLQWRKDGTDIQDATSSVLALTNVPLSAAGTYTLVASNTFGATFASATLTVLPATNLQAGLIGHWPLDATDGISTPDASGNGNALFLTNLTAGEFGAGVRGNAVTFNGTNSLLVRSYTTGNVLPAYQYQAFTVALWVKGTNGQVDRRVFSESSTVGNNQLINLGTDNAGASPKADVFIRNDAGTIPVNHGKSTNAAFDGVWHHLVMIDNNGTVQIYIDGVLDLYTTNYAPRPGTFTLNTLAIGGIQRSTPLAWFAGQLDDVMIWRRTLSSNEVFCAYTNGLVRPAFTVQPANAIVECTGNASFTAATTSVDPVTYQWFRNGNPIPDATNASLLVTSLSLANSGSTYAVRARNCAGDTFSTTATLTVVDTTPPTIACPPNLTVTCLDDVPAPQPGSIVAGDACDAMLSVVHAGDVYTPGTPGVIVRTYAATDDAMNTANCQQIITVLVSRPAPLLSERFGPGGYMPGSLVGQSHGAAGFAAGNWSLGTGNATVSTAGGLTFSSGPLSLQTGGGKVTTPAAGFNTVFALMDTSPTGPFGSAGLVDGGFIGGPNASGTLYYSFLSRNGSSDVPNGDADFAALELYLGAAEIFGVGNNWGAWAYSTFGIGGDGDLIRPSDNSFLLMDNSVHLFVVRIDYVAGANDTVTVWMDPRLDLPEGSQPATVHRRMVSGSATFDRIALRNGSLNDNNSWDYDEIRFGTNWDDVTPTAPAIVTQPVPTVGECGQSTMFSVAVAGTGPLAYQWSKNGSPIPNATNAALPLSNLQESDEGAYSVKVCNPFGSAMSVAANLTVNDTTPPSITCPAPMSVQCLANVPAPNTALPFVTDGCDPTPVVSHVSDVSVGSNPTVITRTYRATDASGNTNDCITLITVQDTQPPQIASCAMDQGVVADNTLQAIVPDMRPGVMATDNCGVASISQSPLPGSMVTTGIHLISFVVSDAAGNTANCTAQLIVTPPAVAPIIVAAPMDLALNCGSNAVFLVTAFGVPNPDYQWFRGANPIPNATNASLSIPGATPADNGVYSVTVSNLYGNTNLSATLTVTDPNPPVILSQPASRTNNVGTSASFTVAVQSCSVHSYQWCFGANPLPDQTNATLTLASVQLSDQGGYSVKIMNLAGAVTSAVAVLTVNRPPVAQPNGGATTENRALAFALGKLLANDTDIDGDALTVTAVSATSTNGGSVVLGAGSATYTPLPGFSGVDRFTYTISDGRGGTATAEVEVLVASGALPSFNQVSIRPTATGYLVRFAGIPGKSYQIQRSPDMTTWTTLTTVVAPLHGIIEYEDVNPPPGSAFYRTVAP